jgi:hypothetical protein
LKIQQLEKDSAQLELMRLSMSSVSGQDSGIFLSFRKASKSSFGADSENVKKTSRRMNGA